MYSAETMLYLKHRDHTFLWANAAVRIYIASSETSNSGRRRDSHVFVPIPGRDWKLQFRLSFYAGAPRPLGFDKVRS